MNKVDSFAFSPSLLRSFDNFMRFSDLNSGFFCSGTYVYFKEYVRIMATYQKRKCDIIEKIESTDSLKCIEPSPCFNLIVASYLIFNRILQINENFQATFWIQFVVQRTAIKKMDITLWKCSYSLLSAKVFWDTSESPANAWGLLLSIISNVRDTIKEGTKRHKWRIWENWNSKSLENMTPRGVKTGLFSIHLHISHPRNIRSWIFDT